MLTLKATNADYEFFLSKLAYAWTSGDSNTLADLYRFFQQKGAEQRDAA
jgi:hypothetical protein